VGGKRRPNDSKKKGGPERKNESRKKNMNPSSKLGMTSEVSAPPKQGGEDQGTEVEKTSTRKSKKENGEMRRPATGDKDLKCTECFCGGCKLKPGVGEPAWNGMGKTYKEK